MTTSHLEFEFGQLWVARFPEIDLHSEYSFCPGRRFRFDFAELQTKVAIEIQGGIFSKERSGHTSGAGVQRDCEKFSLAASLGWLLFPLSESMMRDAEWLDLIATTIQARQA